MAPDFGRSWSAAWPSWPAWSSLPGRAHRMRCAGWTLVPSCSWWRRLSIAVSMRARLHGALAMGIAPRRGAARQRARAGACLDLHLGHVGYGPAAALVHRALWSAGCRNTACGESQLLTTRSRLRCTCRRTCHPFRPWTQRAAAQLADAAERLGGRTLVLTTTLKALRLVGSLLQAGLPVMRQGWRCWCRDKAPNAD